MAKRCGGGLDLGHKAPLVDAPKKKHPRPKNMGPFPHIRAQPMLFYPKIVSSMLFLSCEGKLMIS